MENGTKVRECDDHSRKGTFLGVSHSDPGMVAVEWNDGSLERVASSQVEEYDDQMEQDFEMIKSKVQSAVKLLEEANSLASAHGTNLQEQYYELGLSGLFGVLDDAGWSSSSMRC